MQQIMSRPPCCAPASGSLGDAPAGMARQRLRHLVVTDDTGRCAGVITDRAITAAWRARTAVVAAQRSSRYLAELR